MYRLGSKLVLVALTAFSLCASAAHATDRRYRTLYTFQGGADGWLPVSVPAVDKDGNLYNTQCGGSASDGTVFEISP